MFDDKQPEDIFEGSDKAPAPTNLPVEDQRIAPAPRLTTPSVAAANTAPSASAPMVEEGHPVVSAKVVLIAIIVMGAIGATVAIALSLMSRPESLVPPAVIDGTSGTGNSDLNESALDDEEGKGDEDAVVDELPVVDPAPEVVIDSDGDGLSDDTEKELGTLPENPDSDADGLGDREEAQVYNTDPLNPDTDGDTYLDGAEVQGGYNPNGAGKLLQVPAVTEKVAFNWVSQSISFTYPGDYYVIDLSADSLRISPSQVLPEGDVPIVRMEAYEDGATIDEIISEDLELAEGERTEVVINGKRMTKIVNENAFGGTVVVYLMNDNGRVLTLVHWDNPEHEKIADEILGSIVW